MRNFAKVLACVTGVIASAGSVAAQVPPWMDELGYNKADVVSVRLGPQQMPLIEVGVDSISDWLLFDTGDMVGLSLTRTQLAGRNLPVDSTWRRIDSDGRVIGRFRRLRASSARAFGRDLGSVPIYELDESVGTGLIGPDLIPGTRFTLDYRAGFFATTNQPLPIRLERFEVLPLIRSARHPRLILAYCRIGDRRVLTEFDTGKSRTVIDPDLARALKLVTNDRGVRIDSLFVGASKFVIPSAKLITLAQIDPSLPARLELSVGSDVMSQFVITVDYTAGLLAMRRQ